jgi:2-hydroxy-6-oxonona-2,4-dienedioate hydrolase
MTRSSVPCGCKTGRQTPEALLEPGAATVHGSPGRQFRPPQRRSRPAERFAARRGLWRWALAVASERGRHPAGIGVRGGAALTSRWYDVGGLLLHARVAPGPGSDSPAAVLVHGVIVSSRYLLPAGVELASHFPVIVPDLPGYGLSAGGPAAPTVASLADAAIDCAGAAGHDRINLVGNSFGAQVAVAAAVRHPARVERLVLVGPTVDPDARSLVAQYLRWQRCAADEHLSVLPLMARDLADVGPRRALRLLRVMLDDRIEDRLPQVRCPTLVVRGGRDRVAPDGWARRVAALVPNGRLAVLPGYAHMPHFSGPLALVPLVREFLSE